MADQPSDIDLVKNAAALRCKSLFGARVLADNAHIGPAALEKWLFGHARLAPDALDRMVRVLFNGAARWDDATQSLIDAPKPATAQMGAADMPPVATNMPS
jgi:hypothetical protein